MASEDRTNPYNFAAIDFETANLERDSACAVGVAIVQYGHITTVESRLIRPPTSTFSFTHIHGLTWEEVKHAPTFAEIWQDLSSLMADVDFFAAHNAPFDRGVLEACCRTHALVRPLQPFICTMSLARSVWRVYPTKLPDVCRHLGIPLDHHQAASDAEACARIVLAAAERGWRPQA